MKQHRKFLITHAMLEAINACQEGREAAPASFWISTDPEENVAIACLFADADRARTLWRDPHWLMITVTDTNESLMPDSDYVTEGQHRLANMPGTDAWIAAQHFAMAADAIDCARYDKGGPRAAHTILRMQPKRASK